MRSHLYDTDPMPTIFQANKINLFQYISKIVFNMSIDMKRGNLYLYCPYNLIRKPTGKNDLLDFIVISL